MLWRRHWVEEPAWGCGEGGGSSIRTMGPEIIAPGESVQDEAGVGVQRVLPPPDRGEIPGSWPGWAQFLSGAAEGLLLRAVIQVDL